MHRFRFSVRDLLFVVTISSAFLAVYPLMWTFSALLTALLFILLASVMMTRAFDRSRMPLLHGAILGGIVGGILASFCHVSFELAYDPFFRKGPSFATRIVSLFSPAFFGGCGCGFLVWGLYKGIAGACHNREDTNHQRQERKRMVHQLDDNGTNGG